MSWETIVLLIVIGLGLIAVDFYIPGFVLASIGTVLMLAALVVAQVAYGWGAVMLLAPLELLLGILAGIFAIKYFPQTRAGKKLILAETQAGVRAQTQRGADLIGQSGVARTVLRPAGVAVVAGKRLDVQAESGMIPAGSAIQVVSVQDNNIIVRKV